MPGSWENNIPGACQYTASSSKRVNLRKRKKAQMADGNKDGQVDGRVIMGPGTPRSQQG